MNFIGIKQMKHIQKRINFSVIIHEGYYRIQCDETKELISGKIKCKKKALRILRDHVDTNSFKENCKSLSKEHIKERMKLFKGRLRPMKKSWTIEEATLVASIYNTRGQLYDENQKCYMSAYQKGWLNQICAHMKPSRKVNKFTYGVLNPNTALAKIFDYATHYEFTRANQGAYDALRRFGVDTLELFDNRDSAEYLKNTIKKLATDAVERFVE